MCLPHIQVPTIQQKRLSQRIPGPSTCMVVLPRCLWWRQRLQHGMWGAELYFQAQKLSTLEAHHLQDFSTDTAGDAISRERQVLSWTNVVDAEDWMVETPDRNWTLRAASWPQLLQRIAVMGPDIPQKSKACGLSAGVWMWGQFTLVF